MFRGSRVSALVSFVFRAFEVEKGLGFRANMGEWLGFRN